MKKLLIILMAFAITTSLMPSFVFADDINNAKDREPVSEDTTIVEKNSQVESIGQGSYLNGLEADKSPADISRDDISDNYQINECGDDVDVRTKSIGYGRIADVEKIKQGYMEGLYGAWILKTGWSSFMPSSLVYFNEREGMTSVYWPSDYNGEDCFNDASSISSGYSPWTFDGKEIIIWGHDEQGRIAGSYFAVIKECIEKNGHTVLIDSDGSELIAITDEAYNELSRLKGYNWKNFNYDTIVVTCWEKKVANTSAPNVSKSKLISLKALKPRTAKKSIIARWKKISKKNQKKIKGIEIQVAKDPDFTDMVKRVRTGKKASSKKIKGLSRKTTYYVRVRAYKGGQKGVWSSVKSVKTK